MAEQKLRRVHADVCLTRRCRRDANDEPEPSVSDSLTLVQATSCDVASAHDVAEPMTRFCVAWSSVLLATLFALSTSAAVALATALASASSVSCKR